MTGPRASSEKHLLLRERPALPADLAARVAVAVPAVAATLVLVSLGGLAFGAALALLAVLALVELERAAGIGTAMLVASSAATVGLLAAALYGDSTALVAVLAGTVPLMLAAGLATPNTRPSTAAVGVAVLGVAWIGLGLAHGVLLREQPHGGGLVIDVLVATLIGDTAAHLVGARFGRRPLAARISPAKTVEGLVAGIIVGTAAVWVVASLFQGWLGDLDALALGLVVAIAAPLGDLFESLVKRDLGVKDSGRLLGPHGGVLDRIDALLFAAVAGYYASLGLL